MSPPTHRSTRALPGRGLTRAAQILVVVVLGLNSVRCPAVTSGPEVGCSQDQNDEVLGRPFPDLPADGSVAIFSIEESPAGLQPRVEVYTNLSPSTPVEELRTCPVPDGGVVRLERGGLALDLGTVRLTGVGAGCDGGDCPQVVQFEFRDGGYVADVTVEPTWGRGAEVIYTLIVDLRSAEQRDAGVDPIIREFPVTMSFPGQVDPSAVEIPSSVSLDGGALTLQWPPQNGQFVLVSLRGPQGDRICRALDLEGAPCPTGKACLTIGSDVLGTVGPGSVSVEIKWINAANPGTTALSEIRRDLLIANLVGFGTYTLRFTVQVTP